MFRLLCAPAALVLASSLHAAPLTENFNSLADMLSRGWLVVNNSTPDPGNTSWFQGNPGVFAAQSGASDSYAAANFLAAPLGGQASVWLISPLFAWLPGGTISFYTRTVSQPFFNDTLEVRTNFLTGDANAGSTPTSVGNFSLSGVIGGANPYPTDWTQVSLTNGSGGVLTGRIGFRYVIPDTSSAGEYIGLDTLTSTGAETGIPEPGSLMLLGGALLAMAAGRHLRRGC